MELSFLLAQVMGLYLILEGIVVLARRKFVVSIVNDMSKNRSLMFVTGAMAIILGLLVVLSHNVWEATWRVVPTLIGWLMLIEGILIFFIPGVLIKWAKLFARQRNLTVFVGILALILGAYLAAVGFQIGL